MKALSCSIKIICCFLLFSACSTSKTGYTVTPVSKSEYSEKESRIIYALPKTILKVDVVLMQQEKTKGIYSEFASKLLNITDVVSNNQTIYSVISANVSTFAEPDENQYYFVDVNKSPIGINVSPSGILRSVNFSAKKRGIHNPKNTEQPDFKNNENTQYSQKEIAPLPKTLTKKVFFVDFPVEGKISSTDGISLRKQAEDAANYINTIRQKKMGLLSGDYDDQYSSHAIEFMYTKLDSLEKHYLELFTGCVRVNYISESYTFEPQKAQLSNDEISAVLFRYSETEGILSSQEASGIPFQIRIKLKNKLSALNKYLRSNTNEQDKGNGFYYRIPEETTVVLTAGHLQKEETVLISQLGAVLNLPKLPFNALFDVTTGNIVKYNVLKP